MLFLALLILSLFISMFFSASEAALLRLNRYQIQSEKSTWTNNLLIQLLNRIDEVLILILMGNTFANIWSASMLSFYLTSHDVSAEILWLAPFFLTIIILIFAEVIPKTLATYQPKRIASLFCWILNGMLFVMAPAVWIIKKFNKGFLNFIGISSINHDQHISFKEYKLMISEGLRKERTSYHHMMMNVLELHELTVNNVMVTRSKLELIDLKKPFPELEHDLMYAEHRWVPLIEGSLDHIVGFLRIQDCIPFLVNKTLSLKKIRELMMEAYFIPDKTPLSVQYGHFHRESRKIGLVVDEYGCILGLMSIEDILNYLSVEDFSLLKDSIQQESPDEWIVPGELSLSAFRRLTGIEVVCELATTIGGALIEHLEHIPETGMQITINNILYEALQSSDQKVLKVRVILPNQCQEESSPE